MSDLNKYVHKFYVIYVVVVDDGVNAVYMHIIYTHIIHPITLGKCATDCLMCEWSEWMDGFNLKVNKSVITITNNLTLLRIFPWDFVGRKSNLFNVMINGRLVHLTIWLAVHKVLYSDSFSVNKLNRNALRHIVIVSFFPKIIILQRESISSGYCFLSIINFVSYPQSAL